MNLIHYLGVVVCGVSRAFYSHSSIVTIVAIGIIQQGEAVRQDSLVLFTTNEAGLVSAGKELHPYICPGKLYFPVNISDCIPVSISFVV